MILTQSNYFSKEASEEYWSVSQFKSFDKCEAMAMAELQGLYERESTKPLLVGSYVDAYFEGTLVQFEQQHPEILKRDGSLKSDFVQASEIIRRLERDEFFMSFLSGEKQKILTGKLFGYDWKIKVDSLFTDKIVDLKVMRSFESVFTPNEGRLPWWSAWKYDIQGAVYQAIEGNHLPFYLAAATKEKVTDYGVFEIPQYELDAALKYVEHKIDHFQDVKAGFVEPVRCEQCEWCKLTRKLKEVKTLSRED